jgi:hypothetical protein
MAVNQDLCVSQILKVSAYELHGYNNINKKKTYLEYVPYDRFIDVKSLGGLGDFTAETWLDNELGEVLTAETWLDNQLGEVFTAKWWEREL